MKSIIQSTLVGATALYLGAVTAGAVIPMSGRPVPTMSIFDRLMTNFVENNSIEAALLGIMSNGKIVFLRGYGSLDAGVNMPENALVRLASCTKPFTAAAIRRLDAARATISVTNFAFNINGNGGLLNYAAFPNLGDARLDDITIDHLLRHRGGWTRTNAGVGDLTYKEATIANDMGIPSPPGRVNTMRWILGQPLQFRPGTQYQYSNIGYLALGLIVGNNASGAGYLGYVEQNVVTPEMWIPATEIEQARTFRADRNPREPWYRSNRNVYSVFFALPTPPAIVSKPYGGFDVEARLGQGGVIASAAAMLMLGNTYHISPGSAIIGLPIDATNPLTGDEAHNGSQSGVNTRLWHRTDGVVVFVFFNKDKDEYDGNADGQYASEFTTLLDPILDAGTAFAWPITTSDGFWVVPDSVATGGVGGYHDPFEGLDDALAYVTDGSKLRLKPGASSWTGTITKRLLVDAPLGPAIIGQ